MIIISIINEEMYTFNELKMKKKRIRIKYLIEWYNRIKKMYYIGEKKTENKETGNNNYF